MSKWSHARCFGDENSCWLGVLRLLAVIFTWSGQFMSITLCQRKHSLLSSTKHGRTVVVD
jgi:hypothetical protein